MRRFQTAVGPEVDLDDPATYAHLPQTLKGVTNQLYREIGYARVYVLRNARPGRKWDKAQRARIKEMVRAIAADADSLPLVHWQERLFLFLDEIENMC